MPLDMDMEISASEAAELLGVTPRWVQMLSDEGYIEKVARGRYRLESVVKGYGRHLTEKAKARQQSESARRVANARAADLEQKTAIRNRELIELDESLAAIDEIAGLLKSGFDGLPAQVTRDIQLRRTLEAAIDAIFSDASKRALEIANSLSTSGVVMDADAEA